jgi:hypothetical protein
MGLVLLPAKRDSARLQKPGDAPKISSASPDYMLIGMLENAVQNFMKYLIPDV